MMLGYSIIPGSYGKFTDQLRDELLCGIRRNCVQDKKRGGGLLHPLDFRSECYYYLLWHARQSAEPVFSMRRKFQLAPGS